MRAYTVHEPPQMAATRAERAEGLLFLREGFSWGAALFGPFYFIFRAQWLALAAYVAAGFAIRLFFHLSDADPVWTSLLLMALNVIAGFEAKEFERWSLARRGWREVGSVSGPSHDECERRFLADWIAGEPPVTPAVWMTVPPPRRFSIEAAETALRGLAARLRTQFAPKV